jgi:CO/xanthine dehydrogenase Mo-binding subunit
LFNQRPAAKGIEELLMDGPALVILNVIENATGKSFNHIPLMPEAILAES